MKSHRIIQLLPFLLVLILLVLCLGDAGAMPALAANNFQDNSETEVPTETPIPPIETPTPTSTLPPTEIPTPTSTLPPAFSRPQIVVGNYYIGSGKVGPGQDFTLKFQLRNDGQSKARNLVVAFATGDFIPRRNGGVLMAGTISPGTSTNYEQALTVNNSLQENSIGVLSMQVTYSDDVGSSFSDSFSLGISVAATSSDTSGYGLSLPRAPTPTSVARPQLLILTYSTDAQVLKPGTQFSLTLEILNVGGSVARRVTMVMGGGTSVGGTGQIDTSGKSDSGGLAGGGGDYSNFAPIGSSNVQFLGDLPAQDSLSAEQRLIVNSNTKPGAYPVRFSLLYMDDKGTNISDDQVITLLVLSPPSIDVSLYRTADPFFVGQPWTLPLQVINLDRNSIMLCKVRVTAAGVHLENNNAWIGYLDAGGFFTLDPLMIPEQPGALTILITIDYLDDFNQTQSIQHEIVVDVMDNPATEMEPNEIPGTGMMPPPAEETLGHKVWRFLIGFLGFDSGPSIPAVITDSPAFEETPIEISPVGTTVRSMG